MLGRHMRRELLGPGRMLARLAPRAGLLARAFSVSTGDVVQLHVQLRVRDPENDKLFYSSEGHDPLKVRAAI